MEFRTDEAQLLGLWTATRLLGEIRGLDDRADQAELLVKAHILLNILSHQAWYKTGTCCCFLRVERCAQQGAISKGAQRGPVCCSLLNRVSVPGGDDALRWPSGFVCPVCAGQHHSVVKTRALYQCSACRRQTSVIAGTIFAATKVPLCTWFRAMYHLTQSKGGISSIELGRRLGVTQTTAWKIKHKLMQAMMERDATKRLTGRIEIDDAYLGVERNGGKRGRGSPGKTPIVAAVETTPEGKPIRLKLRRVRVSAGPKSRSWRSAISIPPAPLSVTACTASLLSATPAASTSRSSLDPVARLP